MKLRLPTSTVRTEHEYTRSSIPWQLDAYEDEPDGKTTGRQFGRRLFHYISGGGLRGYGRTVEHEEANQRRTRFLIASGIIGVAWVWFLVI